MSVETILRNVYSYLEVLEASQSDVVRHWSEDSLDNALKWAYYCEQIYNQSRGKPYLPNLEEQIRKFNSKPWNLGGNFIHLGFFKNAKHHLTYALLQNPYLSAHLYSSVVKSCLNAGQDEFVQVCHSLCEPRLMVRITESIKESLSASPGKNEEGVQSETRGEIVEASALLLYRSLSHIFRTASATTRTDTAVRKTLDELLNHPHGFEVLMRCIHLGNPKSGEKVETAVSTLTSVLIKYVEGSLDKDTSLRCIHSVPTKLLSEVAANSNQFFDCYLRHIVKIGNTVALKPRHTNAGLQNSQPQRRAPPTGSWSYDELLARLVALQSEGLPVSQALEQLTRTIDSPVWERVGQDLVPSQNKVGLR